MRATASPRAIPVVVPPDATHAARPATPSQLPVAESQSPKSESSPRTIAPPSTTKSPRTSSYEYRPSFQLQQTQGLGLKGFGMACVATVAVLGLGYLLLRKDHSVVVPTPSEAASGVDGATTHARGTAAPTAVTPSGTPTATAPGVNPSTPATPMVDVHFTSTPSGATVTVVDKDSSSVLGETPLVAPLDPSRTYDVTFTTNDHIVKSVHVSPKDTANVDVDLLGRSKHKSATPHAHARSNSK